MYLNNRTGENKLTSQALWDAAAELTSHVTWGRKYRQCWLLIQLNSETALNLLDEAGKQDLTAYQLLQSYNATAAEKTIKLAKWLEAKEASLNKLMQEVDPDVAVNR